MELKKHLSAENYKEKKNKYYLEPLEVVTTKEGLFYRLAMWGAVVFGFFIGVNVLLLFLNLLSGSDDTVFFIKTIVNIIVCGVLVMVLINRMKYFKKRDTSDQEKEARRSWLINNGIQADGKIVFILQKIEVQPATVDSASQTINRYFFDVEYYDKEEHGVRTVTSVEYCNDISKVFADDKVKIYFNPNNKNDYIIEDIKLRQSDSDPARNIPIKSWQISGKKLSINKADDYT